MTALMDPPFLRFSRPCDTTHLYEMPFRLAALQAGLELEDGTSPPVRRPVPDFERDAKTPKRYDVIRAYLRLLGSFDLFLQARDRTLMVDDPNRATARWPVLGRPGAVLLDGEIAGLWRPRTSGKNFRVNIELWAKASASVRKAITEQAERLAAYQHVVLSGMDVDG